MLFFEIVLVLLFSFFLATLASFFNVVIVRTAREESFTGGRSKCDTCGKQIAWFDNVPLFSFLLLRGKCRHCHKAIARTYFTTELLAFALGIIFYLLYAHFAWWQDLSLPQLVLGFLIFFVLTFVFLADWQYMLVPDFFVLLLGILVLIWQIVVGGSWLGPLTAVFFSTLFFGFLYFVAKKILGKEALGLGDLKLMVPLSFLLSWPNTVLAIFLAFIIGGIFAMLILLVGKKKFGQALPFAPFLLIAFGISFFYGEMIWQWYLGYLF
jgi:prepilin signal peptidase PulO-like enzyme (type II secretory pathway)